MEVRACVWTSEDHFQELVLAFHPVKGRFFLVSEAVNKGVAANPDDLNSTLELCMVELHVYDTACCLRVSIAEMKYHSQKQIEG